MEGFIALREEKIFYEVRCSRRYINRELRRSVYSYAKDYLQKVQAEAESHERM